MGERRKPKEGSGKRTSGYQLTTNIVSDLPDLISQTNEGLHRIKRIVSDLKGFSRPDEGVKKFVDLNQLLGSSLNMVWNEIKFKAQTA